MATIFGDVQYSQVMGHLPSPEKGDVCSHSSGGKGLQVGPSTTEYLQTGPTEAPTEAASLGAFWFLVRRKVGKQCGVLCGEASSPQHFPCEDERIQSPCGR